jgi:eukaryotic-like serine/threonine-protein kinase
MARHSSLVTHHYFYHSSLITTFMTPEQWEQVGQLYQAAIELRPDQRTAFLKQACGEDMPLRREVESLLAAEGEVGDFLAAGAIDDAAKALAQEKSLSLVGKRLGHYSVRSLLGAGGMGEVYLAQDTHLNRPVGLKLIPTHLMTDPERVRRFRQEALAASALNHPNIITVYEIGEHEGRALIVTEFVHGVTLRRRMRGAGLSLIASTDVALQIASALGSAHDAGIVHRDIKPENIMMRPDGLVKVLDFGIAKYTRPRLIRDPKESWIKTETGTVIGTTAYMSPEQARGLPVDARTDIWSLGVILYEMIAHRLPFPGSAPTDRIAAILEREPEPLSRLRRGIPAELERIVSRALAKNRDERYASAADLAVDLRKLRSTLPEELSRRFTLPMTAPGLSSLTRRRALLTVLVATLLVLAALLAYLSRSTNVSGPGSSSAARLAAIDSLAVLPFDNESGSSELEYLSDGITESLINGLSQLPHLSVKARSSVFHYKGKQVEPQQVATALSVQAILHGRVVQRGADLSLYLSLVDGRNGDQLWGEQYNRKLTDLLALQSEITRDVSRKLGARLSGADEQRLTKNYTENVEAYQLYLKGRYHLLKNTRMETQNGVAYFRQAIENDPSYTLAYIGLADAYRVLALSGEMPATDVLPEAKAAAQKAVEIDDRLAEAHAILGMVILWYDWDWDAAENQLKRALELDPNSADTHQAYATLLSYTGRHAEAIGEIKRARELDPLNLRTSALEGAFLINAERADEALVRLRQTLELDPNYWFAQSYAASAYIEKGMLDEAVAEARKARESSDVATRPTSFLGYALAKAGRRAEARAELDALLKLIQHRYVSPYNIAMIYLGLGERDETFVWLERGYRQREPRMIFLKTEPKWNSLHEDPRFQDLLRRIGF